MLTTSFPIWRFQSFSKEFVTNPCKTRSPVWSGTLHTAFTRWIHVMPAIMYKTGNIKLVSAPAHYTARHERSYHQLRTFMLQERWLSKLRCRDAPVYGSSCTGWESSNHGSSAQQKIPQEIGWRHWKSASGKKWKWFGLLVWFGLVWFGTRFGLASEPVP